LGCKKDDVKPVVKPKHEFLVRSDKVVSFTAGKLRSSLSAISLSSLLVNDVTFIRLPYKPNTKTGHYGNPAWWDFPRHGSCSEVAFNTCTIASLCRGPYGAAAQQYRIHAVRWVGFSLGFNCWLAPDLIGFGSFDLGPYLYFVEEATASA